MKKLFALLLTALLLTAVPALASAGPDSRSADPATCAHHFEVSVVREATCGQKGLLAYTCAKCGLTYTAETLPTGEHDYALAHTTATCTEDGEATYTCTVCGDSYTEPAPAAGHVPAESADCEKGLTCTVCGQVLLPPTGHQFVYQMDAAFDENGALTDYGTWQCARCGAVMAATRGNAERYYGLAAAPTPGVDEASDADLALVGQGVYADEASPSDAGIPPAAEDGVPDTPIPAGEEPPAIPKQRMELWLGISAVALVVIVAEVVLLVRSLRKSKTPLD